MLGKKCYLKIVSPQFQIQQYNSIYSYTDYWLPQIRGSTAEF